MNETRLSTSKPVPPFLYRPQPIEGDALSTLICKCYAENFSIQSGLFTLNKQDIVNKAVQSIRSQMCTFLDKNLPMRSPKQSKLYRWAYRAMPSHTEFNEGLILLYAYICKYSNSDSLRIPSEYKTHQDNAIALLDAMRIKYE
jgi:hypothetical protein